MPNSLEQLEIVKTSLDDDKAVEPVVIDLSGKSSLADYLVVASGTSSRQVAAMAGHLSEKLKAAGLGPIPVEGLPQGDWVLVDGGDVIVHLFRPEVRDFYNLEKLWSGEAPVESSVDSGSVQSEPVL